MSQEIINWVVGSLLAILGWFGRAIWEEVKELTKRVNAMEVLVAGNYVEKSYFEAKIDALFSKFDKLKDSIDHKFDDIKDRLDEKVDK